MRAEFRTSCVACLCASLLVACGGGGGDGASTEGETALSVDPTDGQGVLYIETRGTRTTVDAWFSLNAASLSSSATDPDWQSGQDLCWLSDGGGTLASAPKVSSSPATLDAGSTLTLASRSLGSVQLEAQRLGDTIVYATEDRWVPTVLPDDLLLDIEGGPGFPAVQGLAVTPVSAPELLQPADGLLSSVTDEIQWDGDHLSGSRIHLSVSSADLHADSSSIQMINCELDDDGRFSLPAALTSSLAPQTGYALTLSREFTAEHTAGASSLLMVSSAYH